MLFHSVVFLVFFCVVVTVYWRLPHRGQNGFLFLASMVFYGSWNWKLLPLIIFSATIDYVAGWGIDSSSSTSKRRAYLMMSLVTNLGLLGFFKYYDFFAAEMASLLSVLGVRTSIHTLEIVLPVGISFYTFQSMSYTIDVYRGLIGRCRSYGDFLLYVSYFPQLVAGPIERAGDLLPRIVKPRRRLLWGQLLDGLKLMAIGYFQKVAIADTMAPIADVVFDHHRQCDSVMLLTGVYAFAIQIYCDFAGYSNIARGASRLLGISLMKNFDQPYFSANVQEFWRRWHISLSTWLRDYVYIPLGGNRHGAWRTRFNLMATMLLGGLWHGAAWRFVIWGGLHGLYLIGHRSITAKVRQRDNGLANDEDSRWRVAKGLLHCVSVLFTFHLVCVAWIFFRAETTTQANEMLLGLAVMTWRSHFGLESFDLAIYALLMLALDVLLERFARRESRFMIHFFSRNWVLETLFFTLMVLFTLLVGQNNVEPFLYFQF